MDMPTSAQALYFHLGMHGDDDGFVASPKKIVRAVGCNDDDLRLLASKGYIIPFESGIVVITDWLKNNNLRNDRYHATTYQHEKQRLTKDQSGAYMLISGIGTTGIPTVSKMETEQSLTEPNITEPNITEGETGQARPRSMSVSLETVEQYCTEVGAPKETAAAFFDYYAARGWEINGRPVKDWKALFRSWLRRERDKSQAAQPYAYDFEEGESL